MNTQNSPYPWLFSAYPSPSYSLSILLDRIVMMQIHLPSDADLRGLQAHLAHTRLCLTERWYIDGTLCRWELKALLSGLFSQAETLK
jgi:hypothetical protein